MPVFLKYFTDFIDAWTANGVRYGFSALILAPYLLLNLRQVPPGTNIWRDALVPSIVNMVGQVA